MLTLSNPPTHHFVPYRLRTALEQVPVLLNSLLMERLDFLECLKHLEHLDHFSAWTVGSFGVLGTFAALGVIGH